MAISYLGLPVLLVIALLLIFAGVAAVRAGAVKGGHGEVINRVYIYLVLFATLMMTIGGSVAAFSAVADIVAPAPYYQTFEDYKMSWAGPHRDKEENGAAIPSEEELRKSYEAMLLAQKENQIEKGKSSLVRSLGWIVVPLPVFLFFQRRLAKENSSAD